MMLTKSIWPALRELIQAEAKLAALLDRNYNRPGGFYREEEHKEIESLRAQVSRMEAAVRESLPDVANVCVICSKEVPDSDQAAVCGRCLGDGFIEFNGFREPCGECHSQDHSEG